MHWLFDAELAFFEKDMFNFSGLSTATVWNTDEKHFFGI